MTSTSPIKSSISTTNSIVDNLVIDTLKLEGSRLTKLLGKLARQIV